MRGLEKGLESFFKREVKKAKGLCLKVRVLSMIGFPDRLVILEHGVIFWAELKRYKEEPRKMQLDRHKLLRSYGHVVYTIDTKEKALWALKRESAKAARLSKQST